MPRSTCLCEVPRCSIIRRPILEISTNISGKYVTQVAVGNADGVLTVTYGNDANTNIAGDTLELAATDNTGSVSWECRDGGGLQDKWLPAACR